MPSKQEAATDCLGADRAARITTPAQRSKPNSTVRLSGGLHELYGGTAGGGQVTIASTLGGFVDAHVDTVATVVAQAGNLRALSFGGHPRNPQLPDVPSLREIVPGLDMSTWFGIVGPPAMPTEIVSWLHTEIVKALRDPQVSDTLTKAGYDLVGNSPSELRALIREESAAYKTIAEKYKLGG